MQSFYKPVMLWFAILPSFLFAQNEIPNPGFEDWANDSPQTWSTSNIPGLPATVTQSADAHSGASAVRGGVVEVDGAFLSAGIMTGFSGLPFAVTKNYARLTGFYQFEPAVQTDVLVVTVNLLDSVFGSVAIAVDNLATTNGSYAQFAVELDYSAGVSAADAAFAQIQIAIGAQNTPAPNTFFLLDDLQFEGVVTSVDHDDGQIPDAFTLQQNYPNPFNPETLISYQISQSGPVELAVFNLLGQKVRTLINAVQPAGAHTARWLSTDERGNRVASGVYVYRLTGATLTKKMLLLQ